MSVENRNYVCEVILPENSPVLSAIGKPCSRKSTAKRSAAFEACFMLHQKGFLDGNFVPIYQKYLPQMRSAHLALNSKETSSYAMMIKPKLWEQTRGTRPERLFVTILELDTPGNAGRDCQPLALLTRTHLPDLPSIRLHVDVSKTSEVLTSSLSRHIEVDAKRLTDLTVFTLTIYKDVYIKEFEHNEPEMTYWLAPAVKHWGHRSPKQSPERLIDWDLVSYISKQPEGLRWSVDTPNDQLLNRYLIDPWDGGRRYLSLAIEPTLRPQDPVPEDATPSKTTKFGNTILDYTVSLAKESRKRHASIWCKDQPIIRAEKVSYRLNVLDEHGAKEKDINTRAYLCPQPLHISAVSWRILTRDSELMLFSYLSVSLPWLNSSRRLSGG